MLFEATVQITDHTEQTLFLAFLDGLKQYRSDPFAIVAEPKRTNKLDVLIPVETTPAPTRAEIIADVIANDEAVAGTDTPPTFEDAQSALQAFANKKPITDALRVLTKFGVTKLKDLPEGSRAGFMRDLERELAA